MPEDLFSIILTDGLVTKLDNGAKVVYKKATLKETSVADHRKAVELSEKAVLTRDGYKLLVSEETYADAITMLSIVSFSTLDGNKKISADLVSMELIGSLTNGDWKQIEARVFLIEISAAKRHGDLTDEQYDNYTSGLKPSREPEGKTEIMGESDNDAKPTVTRLAPKSREASKITANPAPE